MSVPQIGGLARIEAYTAIYEFTIKIVDSHDIMVEEGYHIVLLNNRWNILGMEEFHRVSFLPPPRYHLTGIDEIDEWTLLYLKPSDLFSLIRVNKQLQRITTPDSFWLKKVERDFHSHICSIKPETITYKQQYRYLHQIKDIKTIIKDGRLDALIVYFVTTGSQFQQKYVFLAIKEGHVIIVRWFALRLREIFMSQKKEYNEFVKVLKRWVKYAEECGSVSILQFFEENKLYTPDESSAYAAAQEGHVNMVKWLGERQIFPIYLETLGERDPKEEVFLCLWELNMPRFDMALFGLAEHGHIDLVRKLIDQGVPASINVANALCMTGDIKDLKYIEEKGYTPNFIGANVALVHENVEVLEWLESKRILPNVRGANAVYVHNAQNYDPDEPHAGIAWLEKRNILHDLEEEYFETEDFDDCLEYVN